MQRKGPYSILHPHRIFTNKASREGPFGGRTAPLMVDLIVLSPWYSLRVLVMDLHRHLSFYLKSLYGVCSALYGMCLALCGVCLAFIQCQSIRLCLALYGACLALYGACSALYGMCSALYDVCSALWCGLCSTVYGPCSTLTFLSTCLLLMRSYLNQDHS